MEVFLLKEAQVKMKINRWATFAALVLAFIGALIALSGSWLVFVEQAQFQGARIWPLPGFALVDWAIMGTLGFLGVLFSYRPNGSVWLKTIWFVVGALIPLVVLGAFSIGLFVLISLLFILASSIIISIQKKSKWLWHLGLLMVGVICNLGLFLLFIAFSKLSA